MNKKTYIALLQRALKSPQFTNLQKSEVFQERLEKLTKVVNDDEEYNKEKLFTQLEFFRENTFISENRQWNNFLNVFMRSLQIQMKHNDFTNQVHLKREINKLNQPYGG